MKKVIELYELTANAPFEILLGSLIFWFIFVVWCCFMLAMTAHVMKKLWFLTIWFYDFIDNPMEKLKINK